MKSILASAWPPLSHLPVFRYETVVVSRHNRIRQEARRGVCRKTSLPSNTVQELRGGAERITLALPHDEGEVFTEGRGTPGTEVVKDMNRRLQAIHEWRENYESGALYFELRDHLAESQQTEVDDSLRLSLTAGNCSSTRRTLRMFDALSTREVGLQRSLNSRNGKERNSVMSLRRRQEAASEAERAIDHGEQSQGSSSREFEGILDNRIVRDQEAAEHCTDSDELPALLIKGVLAGTRANLLWQNGWRPQGI
jgi:hypothetical protein